MTDHSLDFPEGFDDYRAFEVEAKGYFREARLSFVGKRYLLSFYDPVRLAQDIAAEVQSGRPFFEPNLVVIASLTRANMESAVARLISSGQVSSLIAE